MSSAPHQMQVGDPAATITDIYVGKREAVMAEVGTPDFYKGRYLIQPYGNGEWDAEGYATIAEAEAEIEYLRTVYPNARICWL